MLPKAEYTPPTGKQENKRSKRRSVLDRDKAVMLITKTTYVLRSSAIAELLTFQSISN